MPRCKLYTNGENNTITMGLKECKADDEGDFSCTITTSAGTCTTEFKLFVTVEGGMDFRAMLMKKKVKQKKVVVTKMEWIEPLTDRECQQGKDKQVIMTAKLSKGGYKGKWYQRNETIMADIKVKKMTKKTAEERFLFSSLGRTGESCKKGTSTIGSRRTTLTPSPSTTLSSTMTVIVIIQPLELKRISLFQAHTFSW